MSDDKLTYGIPRQFCCLTSLDQIVRLSEHNQMYPLMNAWFGIGKMNYFQRI